MEMSPQGLWTCARCEDTLSAEANVWIRDIHLSRDCEDDISEWEPSFHMWSSSSG